MGLRKYIPDTVTSMNLLCGAAGVIVSLDGRLDIGFVLMLCAAACDFLDGFLARILKVSSGIGKELDSLADVVSFGLLPSVMLYKLGGTDIVFLRYFPLVLAAFSAFRLAKFNLDGRQHDNFIGLPTPASAMLCGSLACHVSIAPYGLLASWCAGPVFLPLLAVGLSALMVSEIPMFSMKFGGGKAVSKTENVKRAVFLSVVAVSALAVVLSGSDWPLAILAASVAYILVNLVSLRLPS